MLTTIKKTILPVHFYSIGIFVFALFVVSLFMHASAVDGTECHTITNANAVSSIFAPPVNLFSGNNELLISVTCNGNNTTHIEVGNGDSTQYIYMYGYRMVNGKWARTTFTGRNVTGPWIIGNAEASIEGIQSGEKGQILAYVCQYIQNAWKCGCSDKACQTPKWQIQEYEFSGSSGSISKGDGVVDVHYPSRYLGLPGETITLLGSGFEKGPVSTVTWNGKVQQTGLSSATGSSLDITVPNLPPGKYEIRVLEGDSMSKFGISIWIATGENLPAPVINSITPESGLQGGKFTIHGEGFTEVNDVITTFGVLKDLPSKDGKTIVIESYDPFDETLVSYNEDAVRTQRALPINVTIMNTSGNSNMKIFKLNI